MRVCSRFFFILNNEKRYLKYTTPVHGIVDFDLWCGFVATTFNLLLADIEQNFRKCSIESCVFLSILKN